MERNRISASIVSLPIPVTVLSDDVSEIYLLCRQVNEEMALLCNQYPTKFGFFATLPSPEDHQACISEIRYACDELGADGVMLFTSYDDKYLGHPAFAPVWTELAARAAVVLIHPTIDGAEKGISEPFPLPRPVFDWTHETTRTALHLVSTGTLRKHAGCKIILSHGGGTLPYVAGRAADLSAQMQLLDRPAGEFMDECRAFYFDVALTGYEGPLQLLLQFAKPGHVLYGTDFPFAREALVKQQSAVLTEIFTKQGVEMQVGFEVAEALFPSIKRFNIRC